MKFIGLLLLAGATALARGAELNVREFPPGFCVQLGGGDGALTAALAGNGQLVVHALDPDAATVARVREQLQARDLDGAAAVEQWDAPWLPYADNLINVLIAETPGKITKTEMLRVVAPHGTLWTKRDGAWEATRKPWPREFDEWTHWRHDADGNMVSHDTAVTLPTGLRWIAGPPQDPGGRKWYYDHVLVSAAGRNFYLYETEIVARDAFNGRRLWRRDAKASAFTETGVTGGLKLRPGTRPSKVKPVATADRLYAVIDDQLIALDAATGAPTQNFCAVTAPREVVFAENLVLVSDKTGVRAFTPGGEPRWQWTGVARRLIAADGKLFCLGTNEVVALTLASGHERWRATPERAAEAQTCSFGNGVVALECSAWRDDGTGSGIVVLDGDTGNTLWTRNYIPGMTHFKEARTWFATGLLWIQVEVSKKPPTIKVLGLDPRTGVQRKAVGTRGLHCSVPVATDRFFIAPEMEFTDWQTGRQSTGRMSRHSCRLPFIPANGLLNTFPVQCECYPILRGYMGLAQTLPARDPGTPRMQKGPAFDSPLTTHDSPTDWPIYRHDTFRSGATPVALAGDERLWSVQIVPPLSGPLASEWRDDPFGRGAVTPPVCADGMVVLAAPDRHRVVALNAETGVVRWSFVAGGRIDTPPTLASGRCVFGAHDGYVYCLNLADGRLAWRFRAAPREARIAVYGQMESPWPVTGSVLVEDGVAFFAAGRHPAADGGVRVAAVRIRDGKLLWEQPITDMGVRAWYSGFLPQTKQKIGLDYEPVDLLVRDGDSVAMSRWRFEPKTGAMKLSVTSTNFNASGLAVPRGAWGYGIRQTKLVLAKPPTVFAAGKVTMTSTNTVAAILADTTLVTGTAAGELTVAGQTISLGAPLVRDGLMAVAGRLYAATQDGRLICLGRR